MVCRALRISVQPTPETDNQLMAGRRDRDSAQECVIGGKPRRGDSREAVSEAGGSENHAGGGVVTPLLLSWGFCLLTAPGVALVVGNPLTAEGGVVLEVPRPLLIGDIGGVEACPRAHDVRVRRLAWIEREARRRNRGEDAVGLKM